MTSHIEMMVINWSEVSFSPQDFDQLPQLRTHFTPTAPVLTHRVTELMSTFYDLSRQPRRSKCNVNHRGCK